LFKDKSKINNKINFYHGRAQTFDFQQLDVFQMIKKFYDIDYDERDNENFSKVYENFLQLLKNLDERLKNLLMQTIIDLFRPYDSSKNTQLSHLKEILFIMITLEKQKIDNLNKG
jgi:hypothetical protein